MWAERETSSQQVVMDLCFALAAEAGAGTGIDVTPDAPLADFGLDSLAFAELAVALEERFGVRLADGDVEGIRTVEDVVRALETPAAPLPAIPPGIGGAQGAVRVISGWAFRWQTRMRVEGQANVPPEGPVIMAANHRSMMDVPVLTLASPRPVVFMAKVELFRSALGARFFHELGGFPVRRDIADLRAIDIGLAVLRDEQVLAIYPEGKRNYEEGLLDFLSGAAWMALRTGAPIVPCGLVGTAKPTSGARPGLRRHVRVAFGTPIPVMREEDRAARLRKTRGITARLREAVADLVR
jgi:1-acyl-sn-glycerol-3-phosphate acyltransferase